MIVEETKNKPVIIITHDMGVVAEVADRGLVMFNGKIVEQGLPKQIFHNPAEEYTKKLINSVPKLGSMRGKNNPEKFKKI